MHGRGVLEVGKGVPFREAPSFQRSGIISLSTDIMTLVYIGANKCRHFLKGLTFGE